MGPDWFRQVPVGLGPVPRRLYEVFDSQVVEWLYWPGIGHLRRLPAMQGDAFQFHSEPLRPLPPIGGNERWNGGIHSEEDLRNIPVLARSDVSTSGVVRNGDEGSTDPENRSPDSVSSTSYDVWDAELESAFSVFFD